MRATMILNEETFQMSPEKVAFVRSPEVSTLADIFANSEFELRIVGGAVRDLLLGNTPKDIDFATDATPDQMNTLLNDNGIRIIPTGIEHGTITAVVGNEPFELTTLRVDSDHDGRHAQVEFTTSWRLDAERRDLTFNAMSMDLLGNVYDFFDGATDLKNNVAKFVGDPVSRIEEDYLRILRYFRFQGRMQLPTWDKETLSAITHTVGGLKGISGERSWAEMSKILSRPSRKVVLSKMKEVGALAAINLPDTRINMLGNVDNYDPVVAVAMMLGTTASLDTLRSFWKFSNEVYNAAKFIINNRHNAIDLVAAKRMVADPKVKNEHVFALLDALGKSTLATQLNAWVPPVFPVNGSDLQDAGIPVGKEMGVMLSRLRNAWEQSGFNLNKEQLLKEL